MLMGTIPPKVCSCSSSSLWSSIISRLNQLRLGSSRVATYSCLTSISDFPQIGAIISLIALLGGQVMKRVSSSKFLKEGIGNSLRRRQSLHGEDAKY